jgi:hypothetical protein
MHEEDFMSGQTLRNQMLVKNINMIESTSSNNALSRRSQSQLSIRSVKELQNKNEIAHHLTTINTNKANKVPLLNLGSLRNNHGSTESKLYHS